jgi:hypothetical protein
LWSPEAGGAQMFGRCMTIGQDRNVAARCRARCEATNASEIACKQHSSRTTVSVHLISCMPCTGASNRNALSMSERPLQTRCDKVRGVNELTFASCCCTSTWVVWSLPSTLCLSYSSVTAAFTLRHGHQHSQATKHTAFTKPEAGPSNRVAALFHTPCQLYGARYAAPPCDRT